MKGPRYAVYFAPRSTAELGRLGADWLGRDADSDSACAQPEVPGLDRARQDMLTAAPRRYGFHATLKAPFHLAPCVRRDDLTWVVGTLAAELAPVRLPGLRLSRLSQFLALTPDHDCPGGDAAALLDLAAACARRLDPFRAALSDQELRRREQAGLTETQRALLARWGYPYVMEAFRFHMTLTDRVGEDEAPLLSAFLERYFGKALRAPLVIDGLSLFEQPDRKGSFRRIAVFPLGGATANADQPQRGTSDAA